MEKNREPPEDHISRLSSSSPLPPGKERTKSRFKLLISLLCRTAAAQRKLSWTQPRVGGHWRNHSRCLGGNSPRMLRGQRSLRLQPEFRLQRVQRQAARLGVERRGGQRHSGKSAPNALKSEVARATLPVQFTPGGNEVELAFEFKDPILWSPEFPNLYELAATLKTPSGEDSWSCKTGFRDIRTRGTDFLLNGQRWAGRSLPA